MILAYAYETATGAKIPSDKVEERNGKFYHKETGEELRQIIAKMSKSLKNVVNPDDVVQQYGADSLRLYEMFLGPLDATKPWSENGVKGVFGFLSKVYRFFADMNNYFEGEEDKEVIRLLHKTIDKVTNDIENLRFNTAISQMMIFTNLCLKKQKVTRSTGETFAKILSPFAPHLAEEIWQVLGHNQTLAYEPFPVADPAYLVDDTVTYAITFNGKRRFELQLPKDMPASDVEKIVLENTETQKWLNGKTPKKIIVVPGKIVNLVI
jgi:leucyl-tRNA synthetase